MIPAQSVLTGEDAPPFFRLRTALSYCAPFFVNGVVLPFFPVWLASLHFDDHEIGVILAVPMVVRVLVAPVVAVYADRIKERADVLLVSAGLSLLTAIALFFTESFWPVLIVFTLQGASFASYIPVVESIAISGVRRWGFDYGSIRVWGSIAFILSTMVGGQMIGLWGGPMVLPVMVLGFVLTMVMGIYCPRVGPKRQRAPNLTMAERSGSSLRQGHLLLLFFGVAIQQSSHAALYVFASIYWRSIGLTGTEIGLLWSGGVAAEVAVFFLSRRLAERFDAWPLIRFGAFVCILRWLVFPAAGGFFSFLLLQCLHAFTYALVHGGTQRRIVASVDEKQESAAQGAYFFYNGMFMGLMTMASGYLYGWLGLKTYDVMALLAALGFCLIVLAQRAESRSAGSGSQTG